MVMGSLPLPHNHSGSSFLQLQNGYLKHVMMDYMIVLPLYDIKFRFVIGFVQPCADPGIIAVGRL